MPVTIACPNCDDRHAAPDDIEGKKVRCKKCGETFRARPVEEDVGDDRPAGRAAKSASKSRSRPAADDADEDARPSRRTGKASRRREDDDEPDRDEGEDRPRRRSRDEDDEADEPRPRKKKGKKAKKAGRPVVLFISIGVGVLVLILLFVGIFSGDREPDAAPSGPVSDAGAGADGGAAGDPALPGWLEFADPNGQFKVRVPRMPAAPPTQQWPLSNGEPAEATIYPVEIGGGLYAVAHLVVPGREAGAPADPVLDDTIGEGVGWFKGAVIKSRTNITHQKFPGRQAVLEYPGVKGSTVLRVILAGNRMFWVVAKGDNLAADNPKVRGFFDSLKIN
jgi:hypothetical protein